MRSVGCQVAQFLLHIRQRAEDEGLAAGTAPEDPVQGYVGAARDGKHVGAAVTRTNRSPNDGLTELCDVGSAHVDVDARGGHAPLAPAGCPSDLIHDRSDRDAGGRRVGRNGPVSNDSEILSPCAGRPRDRAQRVRRVVDVPGKRGIAAPTDPSGGTGAAAGVNGINRLSGDLSGTCALKWLPVRSVFGAALRVGAV